MCHHDGFGSLRRERRVVAWRGGLSLPRDVLAEGRDLDGLGAELDVRETEPPADDPAVPEEPFDLIGMRIGADVEVFRPAAQQQIADAAAYEIGDVTLLLEPLKDAKSVRINVPARDRMICAWDDDRFGHEG